MNTDSNEMDIECLNECSTKLMQDLESLVPTSCAHQIFNCGELVQMIVDNVHEGIISGDYNRRDIVSVFKTDPLWRMAARGYVFQTRSVGNEGQLERLVESLKAGYGKYMKIFNLNVRRSSWETIPWRYTDSGSTANWFQDTHILELFEAISFHQVEEVRLYGSMSGSVDEMDCGALTLFMSLLPKLSTSLRLLNCATCNLDIDCEKAILSRIEMFRPDSVWFQKWSAHDFAGNGTARFAIAKKVQVFSSRLIYVMARQGVVRRGIQMMHLVMESSTDVAMCEELIPRLQNLKRLRITRTAGNIPLPGIINSPKLRAVEVDLFSKLWTKGLHRDLINWLIQQTTWPQLGYLSMCMVPVHDHTATDLLDDPHPWSELADVLNDPIRFPSLQMVKIILLGAREQEELTGNGEWNECALIHLEEPEWKDHEVVLGRDMVFRRRKHTMDVIFRAMTEGLNHRVDCHVTY